MIKVKFCTDCVSSTPEINSTWSLRCLHPEVNAKDSWSLSSKIINGSSCRDEREKVWIQFPACGRAGKLWESK